MWLQPGAAAGRRGRVRYATAAPARAPTPEGDGTRAVWKYTYDVRPTWLRRVAHPIGQRLLGREIRKRIEGFAQGCRDEQVLAAARADLALRSEGSGSGE